MSLTNRLACTITLCCSMLPLSFVLFGGSIIGKSWFTELASLFFENTKAGVPIITLAIPVLIAGSACMLLVTRNGNHNEQPLPPILRSLSMSMSSSASTNPYYRTNLLLPTCLLRLLARLRQGRCAFTAHKRGDLDFRQFSILFLVIPSTIYVFSSIHRHLHGKTTTELTADYYLMEIGNSFGMLACVALSWFLIPVARQSPILNALGWGSNQAIQLHIWSGRIVFVGVVIHGVLHTCRWKFVSGESVVQMLFPPSSCWQQSNYVNNETATVCNDPESDCDCYDHFRNLTGFLVSIFMVVIGITSLNYVRRNHYNIFYKAHVLAAPFFLLFTMMHWNRATLYIAPSLLYYMASSAPVLVESSSSYLKGISNNSNNTHTRIVSVRAIASGQRPCVSITFEATPATMQRYHAGQYAELSYKTVVSTGSTGSSISHPFTINRVPSQPNQLRIIFRLMGSFTNELAHLFMQKSPKEEYELPKLKLDGFHGSSTRCSQVLQHDVAILVAGGIGITPFLSMIYGVIHTLHQQHRQQNDKVQTITQEVWLHWICRDTKLIEYVQEEYFDPLLELVNDNSSTGKFKMGIIVHRTGRSEGQYSDIDKTYEQTVFPNCMLYPSDNNAHDDSMTTLNLVSNGDNNRNTQGIPFSSSKFAAGSQASIAENIIPFLSFGLIAWFGLATIWYLYNNVQNRTHVASRGWAALAIVFIGVVVG